MMRLFPKTIHKTMKRNQRAVDSKGLSLLVEGRTWEKVDLATATTVFAS
jgi:hypothetical protein